MERPGARRGKIRKVTKNEQEETILISRNHLSLMIARRRRFFAVGLAWRVSLALLISLLIMLIFFATSASSR